jgi:hypothetical protein
MITINLNKAKTIAHEVRRQKRSEEFYPLDQVIMKQIPGTDVQAVEAERQLIRDKYANLQSQIDAAENVPNLYSAISAISVSSKLE